MWTKALRIFESLGNKAKVSEAKYELGICYYRVGAYDEARIILDEARPDASVEQQGKIVIGTALVEIFTGHYERAHNILVEAEPFFDTASDALKARWHAHFGLVQRRNGARQN